MSVHKQSKSVYSPSMTSLLPRHDIKCQTVFSKLGSVFKTGQSNNIFSNNNIDIPGQEIKILIPKKIHTEQEQLYFDNQKLKQKKNLLTEQNQSLKCQIQQQERQLVMNQEYMSQLENKANKVPGQANKALSCLGLTFNDNSYLVRQLKKTIKALNHQIIELNKTISQLKKDTKYTNVKEVEVEN